MSDLYDQETEQLIDRSAGGDPLATQQLLVKYRGRVRQMVVVRLDTRLVARVDPSDVVQDAFVEVVKRLPGYLRDRPMPFYPWLRQIAWEQLVAVHRRHLDAQKRSLRQEAPQGMVLSDASSVLLAERVMAVQSSPSGRAIREETYLRLRAALGNLKTNDREVLILRFLEQLNTKEIASVLGTNEATIQMRQVRALERLRDLLDQDFEEDRS